MSSDMKIPVRIHKDWADHAASDVALKSSTATYFLVPSHMLRSCSVFFADMLGLAKPDHTVDSKHVNAKGTSSPYDNTIELAGLSTTQIAGLLDHMRNAPVQRKYEMAELIELLALAEQYDSRIVIDRILLSMHRFVDGHAWKVFVIASQYDQLLLARLCLQYMGKDTLVEWLALDKLHKNTVLGVELSYLVALIRGIAQHASTSYRTHGRQSEMQMASVNWMKLAEEFTP